MKKNNLYKFWIYTDDINQKELHISVYKSKKYYNHYTNYFEDPIKDLIIINDNMILFLFVKESKEMLKIIDTKKIINKNKKDHFDINDKDFISIFTLNLINYDEEKRNHKILFNEKGNKLILLIYGIFYFLDYNKETYKFQLISKFSYKKQINTFLLYFKNII